jgi:RimJ/RimL family protein N-acetyltransferase
MLDEELRALTASEPLTLEEEYEMQQKWREDEDKLTFIILARDFGDTDLDISACLSLGTGTFILSPEDPYLSGLRMIGDINLFLKGSSSHRRVNNVSSSSPGAELDEEEELEAEIEIMIAERTYRKKGLAREALQAFLEYAAGFAGTFAGKTTNAQTQKVSNTNSGSPKPPLPVPASALVVRISQYNLPSIRLFESLGFRVVRVVRVFKEVEMRLGRNDPIWQLDA